jgi:chromosome segregation ATPase
MTIAAITPEAGDVLEQAIQAINEGEESTSASEELVAASDESQATKDESTEEVVTDSSGKDSAYQKLLAKYGGDTEKLAAGVFEQQNSLSRMHQDITELKQAILAKRDAAEEEAEDATLEAVEHPDVEWINQELTDLKSETSEVLAQKNAMVQEIVTIDRQIAEYRGQAKYADDFAKATIETQIAQLEARKENKADKWRDLDHRQKQIVREEKEFNRRLRLAQQEIKAERSKIKELRSAEKQAQTRTLNTFFSAFETEAKDYKLSPEMARNLANDVRRDVVDYLRRLPDGTPEQNISELVQWKLGERVKLLNLAKRATFSAKSEEKTAAAKVVGKPPMSVKDLSQRAQASKDKLPDNWSKLSTAGKAKAASERARQILG